MGAETLYAKYSSVVKSRGSYCVKVSDWYVLVEGIWSILVYVFRFKSLFVLLSTERKKFNFSDCKKSTLTFCVLGFLYLK